jgi:hypothetical protein
MSFDPKTVSPGDLAQAVLAAARQRDAAHANAWAKAVRGNSALRAFCEKLALAYGLDVRGVDAPALVAALVVEGIMVGIELQQIKHSGRLVT